MCNYLRKVTSDMPLKDNAESVLQICKKVYLLLVVELISFGFISNRNDLPLNFKSTEMSYRKN